MASLAIDDTTVAPNRELRKPQPTALLATASIWHAAEQRHALGRHWLLALGNTSLGPATWGGMDAIQGCIGTCSFTLPSASKARPSLRLRTCLSTSCASFFCLPLPATRLPWLDGAISVARPARNIHPAHSYYPGTSVSTEPFFLWVFYFKAALLALSSAFSRLHKLYFPSIPSGLLTCGRVDPHLGSVRSLESFGCGLLQYYNLLLPRCHGFDVYLVRDPPPSEYIVKWKNDIRRLRREPSTNARRRKERGAAHSQW